MRERLEFYGNGPSLTAIAMMAAVSVMATLGTHPIAMLLVGVIGLSLVLITIDTGSHSMAVFSGGFLALALGLTFARWSLDGPVPWAVIGVVALAYGDAIRLSFAHRRSGVVDDAVTFGAALGLAIVTVGSLATATVVAALDSSTSNLNWLLVPIALVLAVVGLVGLAVAVSRSPGHYDKRRWRPGERLLAPPREASDDPSFKTSVPPPPR